MAYVEAKGVNKKGEAVFRIYVDGPKKPDGSRNQKKQTYKVEPPKRKLNTEQFNKWLKGKAKERAEDYARELEKTINKPGYREPSNETFAQHVERCVWQDRNVANGS